MNGRLVSRRVVPLTVAAALFMEGLDATVLSTALPAIAADFHVSPIHLKLGVTSYLLSLAIFIPVSGWMADRFGARTVLSWAMAVFAMGSIACALSGGLGALVAARVLQGIGGAMMVPVGRLIILKTTPKHELVDAMAWLTIPALLGPIMGPPVGGFITTYVAWRWIFWINVPIAMLGIGLATLFIPNVREEDRQRFDWLGFLLIGPGLAAFLTGVTFAGLDLVDTTLTVTLAASGAVLLVLYVVHARHTRVPLLDLDLLRYPSFRFGMAGGFLFRVGVGATPFLLPLLLQLGFGFTPFHAGLMTLSIGLGALAMKTVAAPLLRRFGFWRILMVNAVLSSLLLAAPGLFYPGLAVSMMMVVLFLAGFTRSLQFTGLNVAALADVPEAKMSRVTSFTSVLQELAGSVGVTLAALGLAAAQGWSGEARLTAALFPPVFWLTGTISALSVLFLVRMPRDLGQDMLVPRSARAG